MRPVLLSEQIGQLLLRLQPERPDASPPSCGPKCHPQALRTILPRHTVILFGLDCCPHGCRWEGWAVTDEEFLALEREGWDALSSSRGAGYYRGYLSEDALMAFPFGVADRTQAIDAMACAQPWSGSEITSPRVVQVGEGRDRGPLQRERPARGGAHVRRRREQHLRAPRIGLATRFPPAVAHLVVVESSHHLRHQCSENNDNCSVMSTASLAMRPALHDATSTEEARSAAASKTGSGSACRTVSVPRQMQGRLHEFRRRWRRDRPQEP